jgi:hypothetical protein
VKEEKDLPPLAFPGELFDIASAVRIRADEFSLAILDRLALRLRDRLHPRHSVLRRSIVGIVERG